MVCAVMQNATRPVISLSCVALMEDCVTGAHNALRQAMPELSLSSGRCMLTRTCQRCLSLLPRTP